MTVRTVRALLLPATLGCVGSAHFVGGANSNADAISSVLVLAAAIGAFRFLDLRRQRKDREAAVPKRKFWIAGGVVVVALIAALTAGLWMPKPKEPEPANQRPTTTARIEILTPAAGATVPKEFTVSLKVTGGEVLEPQIVDSPTGGHIHLYADDRLITMTNLLETKLTLQPGTHSVRAEYVAPDHAPFRSPVAAAVVFTVK